MSVEGLVEPQEGAEAPQRMTDTDQEFQDRKATEVEQEHAEHLKRRRSEDRTD